MTESAFFYETAVVFLCLGISFLLSGMEAGLLTLSRIRIRQLMHAGNRKASILHGYLEKPESFLWTILIGNTIAMVVVMTLLSVGLLAWLKDSPISLLVCWVLLVFDFYFLCDLVPKSLFMQFPNRLCMLLVGPFRFVFLLMKPIVLPVSWLVSLWTPHSAGKKITGQAFGNREELALFMQEAANGLSRDEKKMIHRVLNLPSITLGHIMVPWDMVETLKESDNLEIALEVCRRSSHTRFPVCRMEGSRKKVVGMLSLKKVLYQKEVDPNLDVGQFVQSGLFLESGCTLEEALKRMQKSGHRLAIVLDEKKREIGVVSLQDILGVLFGNVFL